MGLQIGVAARTASPSSRLISPAMAKGSCQTFSPAATAARRAWHHGVDRGQQRTKSAPTAMTLWESWPR